MASIPPSWKIYIPLLSVLVLILTVMGDYYLPSPDPAESPSDHTHSHDANSDTSDPLDKAFGRAPDPGAVPVDPEREHRMAVFHYNEGNKFLTKGDWKEAVQNYKMALHHDQSLSNAYINMSSAYLRGKQYEEAKKTLDTLKTRAPDHPHLYYNLACYYSLTRQEAASLKALQQSIRLGYLNPGELHTDPDLENLRQTPAFQQWAETL
ncbi:MAG: tetratricopeptide repeat protein [Nitrospinota bacterium]|nr:tetratricopeptide repeat protein [Nitrospinota bacterium]